MPNSLCDLIFSSVFERHPRPRVAIVEFELAWAPHLLSTIIAGRGAAKAATEGVLALPALASLHRLRRDGGGEAPQFSRATSGARNSRNTGDHLACSGPLEEWPRSLSSSK